jgi:hypothetical protein
LVFNPSTIFLIPVSLSKVFIFFKDHWLSFPGVLEKDQSDRRASTNQPDDNGPHHHDGFAPLDPWLLAPEKKLSQQAKG